MSAVFAADKDQELDMSAMQLVRTRRHAACAYRLSFRYVARYLQGAFAVERKAVRHLDRPG